MTAKHDRQQTNLWALRFSLTVYFAFKMCGYATASTTIDSRDLFDLSLEELTSLPVITTTRAPTPMRALPYRVTVISREEIQQQLALGIDTSQILSNLIPGFSPSRQKLSGLGETLRGRSPLFMVDGVPKSDQLRDTSRDGYTIDLESVERIEVLHGANAIHGLGASGGIINFITTPLSGNQGLSTSTLASVGNSQPISSNKMHYKLSALQEYRSDNKALLVAVSGQERGLHEDGNGETVGLEGLQGDLMDTQSRDLLLKAAWEPAQQRMQLSMHHYYITSHGDFIGVAGDTDAGILATTRSGNLPGEMPGNEATTLTLDYTHTHVGNGAINLKVFRQRMDITFGASVTPILQDPAMGPDLLDQSQVRSYKKGAKISYSTASLWALPVDISVGIDFLDDRNEQALLLTNRIWSPEIDFRNYAPFVQADYRINEALVLSAGMRQEYADLEVDDYRTIATSRNTAVKGGTLDFEEGLHNLGAVWSPTPDWNLILNIAEGFSMPDAGRVLRAVNTPGLAVEDILTVTPVVTENREIGWNFHNEPIEWQVSYFESETAFGTRLEATHGVFNVKREQNEVSGWEMTGQWAASDTTQLGVLYSRIEGKFDSNDDGRVDSDLSALDIPPDRFGLSWNQHWTGVWFSRMQINRDFARRFRREGVTTLRSNGYTLVDLMLDYPNRLGMVSLGIANLTNRHYVTYFTQVEGLDDRYFAGRGRTFQSSFRGQF